ncbi:MAG: dTMP kinase [Simkaniaceae bacterium]
MAKKGLFITFEGGEGVGKSTLISSIYEELIKQGLEPMKTLEPGDTPLGKCLREIILGRDFPMDKKAELFLFLADRSQHVKEVILPALDCGKIVLCDRFNDSTIAYQGIARNFDVLKLTELCHFATDGLEPDLTFFLDLDPETGFKRIEKQACGLDRIEKEHLSFHEKVRDAYLTIALREKNRIFVLDASLPKEKVLQTAMKKIEQKLHSFPFEDE